MRQAVKAAFQLWGNVSSLTFSEAAGDSADIRLAFFDGEHNDGARHAFDGPGAIPFFLVSFGYKIYCFDIKYVSYSIEALNTN